MTTPFSLGTFCVPGDATPFVGAVVAGDEDTVLELSMDGRRLPALDRLLADWPRALATVAVIVGARAAPPIAHALTSLQVLPPVRPGQIIQAGANYRSHVLEMSVRTSRSKGSTESEEQLRADAAHALDEQRRAGEPYLFLGSPAALCGAFDDIVLPEFGGEPDWELELAVVIGTRARRVGRAEALDHVAGYTIANDLTARDRVFRADLPSIGTDWFRSKNWPTALPVGPWLTPAQFVGEVAGLELLLSLNGAVMQRASAGDMVFDVADLVSYASALTELRPGDLVLTGSPAGNGSSYGRFLVPGDVIDASITGLGRQRNRTVAAGSDRTALPTNGWRLP